MANEITFDDVVKHIGPYRSQMINQRIETPRGVMILDLTSYQSVSDNSDIINVALHGHDEATPSGHPMPPGAKLPGDGLEVWDAWLAGGKKPGTGIDGNAPDGLIS
ncbi:MAG: hypothetical protein HRT58_22285 [Crocinitomicaceae bacterium]|nr:hypothetical protein [Flavobacteriales bacterium]NQZ38406.1 hypothetical protein [Crocinitomicaceae bacterium]